MAKRLFSQTKITGKCSLIDRAIAEETKGHAIFTSIFAGESETAGQRHVRAHDGMSTVHVMFLVEKMHRTSQAAGTAGIFAEQFRHTGIGAGTAGQSVGMIAIGGDDIIVKSDRRDGTCYNRFLTDVKMTKTADFLSLILLAGALFKAPDEQHQPEHLDFVALLRWLHGNQAARAIATFALAGDD
jgi:hypothetical protein